MYFVRHGESQHNKGIDNSLDSDLTGWGIMQAHDTGLAIAQLNLIGYSGLVSPSRRTRHTASIIAEHTGLNFVVSPSLRDWSGDVVIDGFKYRHETAKEVESRCLDLWKIIAGLQLVVVSHESPLRVLLQLASHQIAKVDDYGQKIDNAKVYLGKEVLYARP